MELFKEAQVIRSKTLPPYDLRLITEQATMKGREYRK